MRKEFGHDSDETIHERGGLACLSFNGSEPELRQLRQSVVGSLGGASSPAADGCSPCARTLIADGRG